MKENFTVKSSTLNVRYEYKTDQIKVSGSYAKDSQTGALRSINGECYHPNVSGDEDPHFGYFNGDPQQGQMLYDVSQMKREDNSLVWDAIEAIEAQVLS